MKDLTHDENLEIHSFPYCQEVDLLQAWRLQGLLVSCLIYQ